MTVFFVTRHAGAVAWAHEQGLAVDRWVAHLATDEVQPGDTVAGTLPVHQAAAVCERGARYLHLCLDLPVEWRGRELGAHELALANARLRAYTVSLDACSAPLATSAAMERGVA